MCRPFPAWVTQPTRTPTFAPNGEERRHQLHAPSLLHARFCTCSPWDWHPSIPPRRYRNQVKFEHITIFLGGVIYLFRARWPPTLKVAMAAKRASQAIGNAHGPKAAARTHTEDSRMTTNRSTMALAIWPATSRRTGKNEATRTPRRSAPRRPARRCPSTSKRVEIRVEHHRHLREGLRQCPGGGYCADPEVL